MTDTVNISRLPKHEPGKKIVFFDADGTILDIKKGIAADVPAAIRALHENGHMAFLCTGRSRAFLPEEIETLGLDGMITNLGCYMELGGRTVYDKEISPDDAYRAMKTLRKYGLVPVMEGSQFMYYDRNEYNDSVNWYASAIDDCLEHHVVPRFDVDGNPTHFGEDNVGGCGGWQPIEGNEHSIHVNKISAKKQPGCDYETALAELSDLFDYTFHEGAFVGSTIECTAKGHSKGLAITILTTVLGYPKEDVIVFGDSNNDLTMFEAGGVGICMGDGSEELKSRADYITLTMDEGGITHGLRKLGLI